MRETIRIQMMGEFVIYLNERQADHMVNKSRKGLALIEYLIVNRGQPVSNQRLLSTFWNDENVTNPENALKTLVSRVRTMLSQVAPNLGSCIVADRGAYHWECLPEMTVDLYELEDIFTRLPSMRDGERKREAYRRMMLLYRGSLLQKSELNEWVYPRATALHNQYVSGVYGYLEMLKQSGKAEDEQEIISVCRSALEHEPFDDRIHIELMRALLKNNNATEAKAQFEEVMHLHYHYLNVKPSRELMEFYNEIVEASKNIEFNLESICRQLYQSSREQGAFVCDFPVFKEIFNLQIRNIERLDTTMFLAVVMVSKIDGEQMESLKQENVMRGLMEILRMNLRKGDVITHFSPTMVAMLLPTVDYSTGDSVMERLKQKFYQAYPNSNVLFSYRIAPLTARAADEAPQKAQRGRGKTTQTAQKEKAAKAPKTKTVKAKPENKEKGE